jgi:uncharacterized protein YjbJ (UPF0337 family)
MNTDEIAGKWKEMKGKARAKWGDITDDDWDRIEGKREQIVGLIQQKYGRAREDAEREVDEFMRG